MEGYMVWWYVGGLTQETLLWRALLLFVVNDVVVVSQVRPIDRGGGAPPRECVVFMHFLFGRDS